MLTMVYYEYLSYTVPPHIFPIYGDGMIVSYTTEQYLHCAKIASYKIL